jgi:hypothetical protein
MIAPLLHTLTSICIPVIAQAGPASDAAPSPGAPAAPTGMSGTQILLMLLFAASMLLVGWLAWRAVNKLDPPDAPVDEDGHARRR